MGDPCAPDGKSDDEHAQPGRQGVVCNRLGRGVSEANPATMMATGATQPYREVRTQERNSLKYGEIPYLDRNFGDASHLGL